MKIKTKAVQSHTYSIEDMTAEQAAAVCVLLGKAEKGLSTATYDIYSKLFETLEKNGDKDLIVHAATDV